MGSTAVVLPTGIDEQAWSLAERLAATQRTPARMALRTIADRGWSSELNAQLSGEQLYSLSARERFGLRRLWEAALTAKLRFHPVPSPSARFDDCPANVDRQAWALTAKVAHPGAARGGLRRLAKLGLATDLNVGLTAEQIALLNNQHRLALWGLWGQATTDGTRLAPMPRGMVAVDGRPPTVDKDAWALSETLIGWRELLAQKALRELDRREQPTALDAIVPMSVFVALDQSERLSLRLLWTAAIDRGVRSAPVPDKHSEWLYRRDLEGIDASAIAFARSASDPLEPYALLWLRRLRNGGLPTDLDVDLEDTAVGALFATMLDEAARRALGKGHDQLYDFRAAVRWMYTGARDAKLRTRPVPQEIACEFVYRKGDRLALLERLPQSDQEKIAQLKISLRELNRRQQAARGQTKEKCSPREKKKTEAQSSSRMRMNALHSLLHHATKWEADDHGAGVKMSAWAIEGGLESLLSPSNVARWCYKGHKPDGSPKARLTCKTHHDQILRLLERAAEAGVPFVTATALEAISAELDRVRDDEEWNVPSALDDDGDDPETGKWFPTMAQLKSGIAALREDWQRAKLLHENGDTFRRFWRATRDYVMAYGAFLCMWRVDTVATIDLSRVVREPGTNRVRWRDGTIRIRNGARAKQAHGHSYLVEMLLIPGEVVDLIEMLLELEGRSLEHRLRPGEAPVQLNIGDHYGADELLETSRAVIPLFRAEFGQPAALNHSSVIGRLQDRLYAMGWDATNPHTLRAAGAIEWRFVRGRTYEAIMRLGLWNDEGVLKRCYAHLNDADIDAEIANGAPSQEVVSPAGSNALAKALEEAQRRSLALQIKPEAPAHELAATARVLRVAASRLERAAGVSDGEERPSPFRSEEDVVRTDQALRPLVKGGLNELLGYVVLQPTQEHREKPARTERRMLSRLRAQTRAASTPRAAARIA